MKKEKLENLKKQGVSTKELKKVEAEFNAEKARIES